MVSKDKIFELTTNIVIAMIQNNLIERSNENNNINVANAFQTIYEQLCKNLEEQQDVFLEITKGGDQCEPPEEVKSEE